MESGGCIEKWGIFVAINELAVILKKKLNIVDKFKKGDKVLEKETTVPILTIIGRTVKAGFPSYTITDRWTCEWTDLTGTHTKEIKEDELGLIDSGNKEYQQK